MGTTCAVRLTRRYVATPAEVWAALCEPASLERWLGPMADAVPTSIRALEPERLLELDWAPPGERPSVVRFELRPEGEGTVLELGHSLIDARVGMRALGRWENHLGRLDALLGAGGRV